MRNVFYLVIGAIALTGCSSDRPHSRSTAATGLLIASAAPTGARENVALGSDPVDIDPVVRLPGFACARTSDTAFHCTRE